MCTVYKVGVGIGTGSKIPGGYVDVWGVPCTHTLQPEVPINFFSMGLPVKFWGGPYISSYLRGASTAPMSLYSIESLGPKSIN